MPQSYDGDIRLSVGINATDAKKQAKSLQNTITALFNTAEGKKLSVGFQRILKSLSDTMTKVDQLQTKMQTLEKTKIYSDEYKKMQKDLEKAEKAHENLAYQSARLAEESRKHPKKFAGKYEEMVQKAKAAAREVEYLKFEMEELEKSGKAFKFGSGTQEYQNLVQQLSNANNKVRVLFSQAYAEVEKNEQKAAQAAEKEAQKIEREAEKAARKTEAEAKKAAAEVERQTQKVANVISQVTSQTLTNMRNILGKAKQIAMSIATMGKSITKSGLSKLGEIFHLGSKHSRGFDFNLKRGITTVLKYAFGIRSLYFLFRKLRGAVKEAFDAMAKQIPEVNQDLSRIVSQWQNFKNALGTMFQPLLAAITPILTKIIDLMTKATIKVGEFFAALTGQKYTYQATQANIDYAKSLDKTTKAKKKKNKEDEKELGAYDKLLVIQKKKKDDDTTDDNGIDASKGLYKKVPIDPKMLKWLDWLKDMWKKGDFFELGAKFAEWLKNLLKKIPWDKIKAIAAKLGKSLATFFNGIFADLELAQVIGTTIAEAINTGIEFAYNFVKNFDFKMFGTWIGLLISKLFRTIDWAKLKELGTMLGQGLADAINAFLRTDALVQIGSAIGNLLRAIVNLIWKLVTEIKWDKLGMRLRQGLNAALNRMLEVDSDNKSGFKKAGEAISGFITGIFTAINEVIGDEETRNKIGKAITEFFDGFDWDALKSAFLTFAKNMVLLLATCIKAMFASGEFKKALGDIAPIAAVALAGIFTVSAISAVGKMVASELVKSIVKNLAGKLVASNFAASVGTEIGALGSWLTGLGSSIASAFSTAAAAVGVSVGVILGAIALVVAAIAVWIHNWDEIKEAAGLFVERTKEHWEELKAWFVENMPNFSELVSTACTNIKNFFHEAGVEVKLVLDDLGKKWQNFLNGAKQFGAGFKQGLLMGVEAIKNGIQAKIDYVKNGFHHAGQVIQSTIEGFSRAILGGLKKDGQEIYNGFVDVFTGVMAFLGDMIKDAFNWGKNLVTNFINGIKSMWHLIPNLNDSQSQTSSGGSGRSIQIFKSTPHLASGAVIPPNREFLATLGDQKSGLNIETPLNTMLEAFKGALNDMGGSGNSQPIVLQLDGRTVAQVVWDEQNRRYRQTGQYNPRMA